MAFELTLTAPFNFSIHATAGHLSMFWGGAEWGIVLETGYGPNPSGKLVETWKARGCGSPNVAAFGLHLIIDKGNLPASLGAAA